MNSKHITTVSLVIASAVHLNTALAADPQIVNAQDMNKYKSQKVNGESKSEYMLKMGTFSSKSYADHYKSHLATKTDSPIHVEQAKNNKGLFYVLVGPFNDLAKMINTGGKLLGKTVGVVTNTNKKVSTAHYTATTTNNKAATTTSPTTAAVKHNMYNPHAKTLARVRHLTPVMQTKHQQILKSQADYPIHQAPKADAKGMIAPLYKTGPYVGVSAGWQTNLSNGNRAAAYQGAPGTLSAGAASMLTRRFYLGGEFFGGNNVKVKNFTGNDSSAYQIASGWNLGGDIIPGYMITDSVLAYLRVGVMRNQFHTVPATATPIATNYRQTMVKNGFRIGFGTQTNLYKNLDGRVEYIFALFNSPNRYTSKVEVNQANVGLVYKFTDSLRHA